MPPNFGTRQRVNAQHERVAQGMPNSSITRDVGMSKNVTTSVTFNGTEMYQTAHSVGTFSAFDPGDMIEITEAPINLGFFTITEVDNEGTFLVLDPPPVNGGPFVANIRTP